MPIKLLANIALYLNCFGLELAMNNLTWVIEYLGAVIASEIYGTEHAIRVEIVFVLAKDGFDSWVKRDQQVNGSIKKRKLLKSNVSFTGKNEMIRAPPQ